MQIGHMQIKDIGSFYVGGENITLSGLTPYEVVTAQGGPSRTINPNGDFVTGQMYVQYVRLAEPKAKYPLLLWHGGGLTGATWETKPDGQSGWQTFFLRAGHDVYVSDAVERGRASWSRYPEIYMAAPTFRPKKEAWESFRIGPTYATIPLERVAFPNTLFPVNDFDQFVKETVPRWSTNDSATQAAYDALIQKMGACVLVVHSQAGAYAEQAAINAPGKVKAIVLLEPSGSPDPASEKLATLRNIPHLFIWGDNIDKYPTWVRYYANIINYRAALEKQRVPVTWIELPQVGIVGNSHMLMMDKNSDYIAAIVQDWLQKQQLMK